MCCRGQYLLSMAEGSAKVTKCKEAVKAAEAALLAAQAELDEISVAAGEYIAIEEEQRQVEQQQATETKVSENRRVDGSTGTVASTGKPKDSMADEPPPVSFVSQPSESIGKSIGFKMKPFKVSLS